MSGMSTYYFKHKNMIMFDDLRYIEDHPYWHDTTIWKPIPGYSSYLINSYGEVIRKRDSFLMPKKMATVVLVNNSRSRESCAISELLVRSGCQIPRELEPALEPATPPVPAYDYLGNYPVILTDRDGEFIRWYPSIQYLCTRPGMEGMNPEVIYNACTSTDWRMCYGKVFRWDPLTYVRFQIRARQVSS
jgi:hypothetical protein